MPVDVAKTEQLLKTARGQIDGILKMVEEGRYCIDVANQLLSLEAIIKKCRKQVLQNHHFYVPLIFYSASFRTE